MASAVEQLSIVYYYSSLDNFKRFKTMFNDFEARYNDNVILKRLRAQANNNYRSWVATAESHYVTASQMENILKDIEELGPKISPKLLKSTGGTKAIADATFSDVSRRFSEMKGANLSIGKLTDVQDKLLKNAQDLLKNKAGELDQYIKSLDTIFTNIAKVYNDYVGLSIEKDILEAIGDIYGKDKNFLAHNTKGSNKSLFGQASYEAEKIRQRIFKQNKAYEGVSFYPSTIKIYLLLQELKRIRNLGHIPPGAKVNALTILQGMGGLLSASGGLALGEVGLAAVLPCVAGTLITNLKGSVVSTGKITVDNALDEYGNKMTRNFNVSKGDLMITGSVKNQYGAEVELSFPVSVKISDRKGFNINSSSIDLLNGGSWGDVLYHFGITTGTDGILALANAVAMHYNEKAGKMHALPYYVQRAQSIVNKMSCYYAMSGTGATKALFLNINGEFIAVHKIFEQLENLNSFSFGKQIVPPVESWYGDTKSNINDANERTKRVINKMYNLKLGTVSWKTFLAR